MAKKSKKGRKLDKGESLYTPELAQRARIVIIEAQLIKSDGSLNYTKLAKILGIPARTFSHWRNPEADYYKLELAIALTSAHKELMEKIDLHKIHASVILKAHGGAKEVTIIKEPVIRGPALPSFSRFTKKDLIIWAKNVLKLTLKLKLSAGEMEMKIREKVEAMTTENKEEIRRVIKTIPTDIPAAKYANQNIGAEDERWTDQQEVKHGVTDGLGNLLKEIGESGSGLSINRKKAKRPVVATE